MNAGGVDKACKSNATPFSFCATIVLMYYVYLIKSKKNGRVYTGYSEDLRQRLEDHNAGKSSYTRNNRPYVLIYYEAYLSREEAQKCECSLKLRSKAYAQLRKRISDSINEG